MLAMACAVGVSCTFAAPNESVFFSIEVDLWVFSLLLEIGKEFLLEQTQLFIAILRDLEY